MSGKPWTGSELKWKGQAICVGKCDASIYMRGTSSTVARAIVSACVHWNVAACLCSVEASSRSDSSFCIACAAMTVHLRRYMETHWQYYAVRICGGSHDGRWLQPMLRENTPQWSDDNGKTVVHLYYGNLPASAWDLNRAWWLLEVKSPSVSGEPWWKVIARHDSFLDGPGERLQWDYVEGADCKISTDRVHENEYAKVKEAQDLELLDTKVKAAVVCEAAGTLEQAKAASATSLKEMEASFHQELARVHVDLGRVSSSNVILAKKHEVVKDDVRMFRAAQTELQQEMQRQSGDIKALRETQTVMQHEIDMLRRKRSRSRRRERCRCPAPTRMRRSDMLSPGDAVYIRDRRGGFIKRFFGSRDGCLYNLTVDERGKMKHRGTVHAQHIHLKDLCPSCRRD